jgi:hypothetical protein
MEGEHSSCTFLFSIAMSLYFETDPVEVERARRKGQIPLSATILLSPFGDYKIGPGSSVSFYVDGRDALFIDILCVIFFFLISSVLTHLVYCIIED